MPAKENSPAVFGPVASRRLGLSLGIDLLDFKTCSLNCVYCELGLTNKLTLERGRFRPYASVLAQVEARLGELNIPPDSLTLAGSGEPTLHLDLGKVLDGLAAMSGSRRVVLTNATLVHLPEVRADLCKADIIAPSLDAISPEVFKKINQPAQGLNPQAMVDGLISLRGEFSGLIWLEILLVKGLNDTPQELEKLRRAVKAIKPDLLQLNTIVRPPALPGFAPLKADELEAVAVYFDGPVAVAQSSAAAGGGDNAGMADIIVQSARMRPCTLEDLAQISGCPPEKLKPLLAGLQQSGRLESLLFDGRQYFRGLR